MANYIPKAEQFDTLNSKLDAINENLKTRASFVEAVAKMENATEAAEEAATAANTAAAGVVSPTATVTKTGDTATITITDKAGTTSAEVKDGSDATVTKDAVVSALGYEPAEKEGNYELINSITISETTTIIDINKDSDGNPFDLAHGYIKTTCPSTVTTSVSGSIYFKGTSADGDLSLSGWYKLFTGTSGNVYYWVHIYGSRVEVFYEQLNSTNSITESSSTMVKRYSSPHVQRAYMYVSAGIPVGVTIELYGIRA